ncbi:MAG: SMR family transporter [Selenomonas sp.]|nr:SMR family transporter [Selenomonas sp.]MCI6085916.1 SMR family transporter [Selenomonas sp.]MCI6283361.1 SMR family transporter [Selenomonas sp.]MDY3297631.1 SMR family transporter [Selenomonas sp.]
MKTAWLILFFAGVTEVTWAIAMKYSEGFTRLVPSVMLFHETLMPMQVVCLLMIVGGIAGLKMLA